MPLLTLSDLQKTYAGGVVGLKPVSLSLAAGERLALLGPSGSGKSTLLRLIAGLEEPTAGEIHWNGKRIDTVPPHRRGIAFVPQKPVLFPQLTVQKNLETARSEGTSLSEAVDLLRLSALLGRFPHQLSGGEKQRVALAKMLLRGAGLWLLDEPFANLDTQFQAEFRHDLHLLLARTIATMILVTHDPIDALALGQRLGVLGDGSLLQLGSAEEVRNFPGHRSVAYSLGQFTLIDGTKATTSDFISDCGNVKLPWPSSHPGSRLAFGIKPEDVRLSPGGSDGWAVIGVEPAGSRWIVEIARGRTRLRGEWNESPPPMLGTAMKWTVAAERGIWFDGASGKRLL